MPSNQKIVFRNFKHKNSMPTLTMMSIYNKKNSNENSKHVKMSKPESMLECTIGQVTTATTKFTFINACYQMHLSCGLGAWLYIFHVGSENDRIQGMNLDLLVFILPSNARHYWHSDVFLYTFHQ